MFNRRKARVAFFVGVLAALGALLPAGSAHAAIGWPLYTSSPPHPVRMFSNWDGDPTCDDEDVYGYFGCEDDLWFAGENRQETDPWDINYPDATFAGTYGLLGTDLGISAYLGNGDKTIVYLGDTWGTPSSTECVHENWCDDAIMRFVGEPTCEDGVDAQVLVDTSASDHFAPLFIPGVNKGTHPSVYLPGMSVPTGVASRKVGSTDQIWLWYGVVIDSANARSYLACSNGGTAFTGCHGYANAQLFSTGKFVNVAPVLLTAAMWDRIHAKCNMYANPDIFPICKLLTALGGDPGDGFLLFGAKSNASYYRNSPLYLGYQDATSTTKRFWNETAFAWQTTESGATSIEMDEPDLFGELSVKMIDNRTFPYLVMLYNNSSSSGDGFVYYRTASLFAPTYWSDAEPTENRGYGPYIIEDSIDVSSGELVLYHMISGWTGTYGEYRDPYGVYSTQLLDLNGDPFPWPPE